MPLHNSIVAKEPCALLNSYYQSLAEYINLLQSDPQSKPITNEEIRNYYEYPEDYKKNPDAHPWAKPLAGKGKGKLFGAICAAAFHDAIKQMLPKGYSITDNNVYIQGCFTEFDFLIVKDSATKLKGLPIYAIDDVAAILECKANGVYTRYKKNSENKQSEYERHNLYRLVEAYYDLDCPKRNIRLGYMTLSEYSSGTDGGSSDFIGATEDFFSDALERAALSEDDKLFHTFFARRHYTSRKKTDTFMTDDQWKEFVNALLPWKK